MKTLLAIIFFVFSNISFAASETTGIDDLEKRVKDYEQISRDYSAVVVIQQMLIFLSLEPVPNSNVTSVNDDNIKVYYWVRSGETRRLMAQNIMGLLSDGTAVAGLRLSTATKEKISSILGLLKNMAPGGGNYTSDHWIKLDAGYINDFKDIEHRFEALRNVLLAEYSAKSNLVKESITALKENPSQLVPQLAARSKAFEEEFAKAKTKFEENERQAQVQKQVLENLVQQEKQIRNRLSQLSLSEKQQRQQILVLQQTAENEEVLLNGLYTRFIESKKKQGHEIIIIGENIFHNPTAFEIFKAELQGIIQSERNLTLQRTRFRNVKTNLDNYKVTTRAHILVKAHGPETLFGRIKYDLVNVELSVSVENGFGIKESHVIEVKIQVGPDGRILNASKLPDSALIYELGMLTESILPTLLADLQLEQQMHRPIEQLRKTFQDNQAPLTFRQINTCSELFAQ